MTEQQRKNRIEFVKKLITLNDFYQTESIGRKVFSDLTYMKDIGFSNFLVSFKETGIVFGCNNKYETMLYDQPLTPLR